MSPLLHHGGPLAAIVALLIKPEPALNFLGGTLFGALLIAAWNGRGPWASLFSKVVRAVPVRANSLARRAPRTSRSRRRELSVSIPSVDGEGSRSAQS